MRSSAILRQTGLYLIGNVGTRLVGFLMIPLYTHYLSSAEYGIIELLELCIQISAIIVGMGAIGGAMIRIYYDYLKQQDRDKVVSCTILLSLALGLCITIIAWPAAPLFSRLLFRTPSYTGLVRVAFVAFALSNPVEIALIYLRIRSRAGLFVVWSLIQLVLSVGLNVYFIAYRREGVWGFALSKLVVSAFSLVAAIAYLTMQMRWSLHRDAVRRICKIIPPLLLASGSYFIIHFSDRFFLARYATLSDIGVYSLAYKFGFLLTYFAGDPFGKVWNATIYDHLDPIGWERYVARVGMYLFYVLCVVGTAIVVFSGPALRIMATPAFLAGRMVVPIVVAAYVAREMGDFFRPVFLTDKRADVIARISLACAVLNLIFNGVFIPRFGMMGAAWSTLATWGTYMVICWWIAVRSYAVRIPLIATISMAALSLLAYGVFCHAKSDELARQFVLGGAVIAVLLLITWTAGFFSREEKQAVVTYFWDFRRSILGS